MTNYTLWYKYSLPILCWGWRQNTRQAILRWATVLCLYLSVSLSPCLCLSISLFISLFLCLCLFVCLCLSLCLSDCPAPHLWGRISLSHPGWHWTPLVTQVSFKFTAFLSLAPGSRCSIRSNQRWLSWANKFLSKREQFWSTCFGYSLVTWVHKTRVYIPGLLEQKEPQRSYELNPFILKSIDYKLWHCLKVHMALSPQTVQKKKIR